MTGLSAVSHRFRLSIAMGVAACGLCVAAPAAAQPVEGQGQEQTPTPECKPGETKKETSIVAGKTVDVRVTEYVCNKEGKWEKVRSIQRTRPVSDGRGSAPGPTTVSRTKRLTTVIDGADGTTRSSRYFVREGGRWKEVDSLPTGDEAPSVGPTDRR